MTSTKADWMLPLANLAASQSLTAALAWLAKEKRGFDSEELRRCLAKEMREKMPKALEEAKEALAVLGEPAMELSFASSMALVGVAAAKKAVERGVVS